LTRYWNAHIISSTLGNFDNPNVTFTSATFGKVTSATANARQIQFALRREY